MSVSLFLVANTKSIPVKIAIIVVVALYPFYIMYIAGFIGRIYNFVLSVFPKNVYKDTNM